MQRQPWGPHGAFPIPRASPALTLPHTRDELPQVPEAVFLGDGVRIVAVLVGNTVGL